MKKVMVFGTFDIFHPGHINFLDQARKYGDELIVVVARDKTVLDVKKELPRNNEEIRAEKIRESGLANVILLGNEGDKYKAIKDVRPDVICLGYDQKFFIDKLKDKLKEFKLDDTRIIRLKSFHPEKYKSSKLKIT